MKAPAVVLIPFVCPICAGANEVHLITLSRAGGVACVECKKWLRATDVMRAIHSPRAASSTPRRTRTPATQGGSQARRDAIVWPPTPESRAAVKPLYVPR